jgi:hypothetical protein
MPSEGNAFLLGDRAGKFVSAVEGRPNEQQLLALAPTFQPDACPPKPAAVRNGDRDGRSLTVHCKVLLKRCVRIALRRHVPQLDSLGGCSTVCASAWRENCRQLLKCT